VATHYANTLEELGCDAHLAPNVEEAIHTIASTPLTWAILDTDARGVPTYTVAQCLAKCGIPFSVICSPITWPAELQDVHELKWPSTASTLRIELESLGARG
jgi:hypothetical protein